MCTLMKKIDKTYVILEIVSFCACFVKFLICIFQSDSRAKVIEGIHKAMKHIDDDELLELSVRVAGKLESIGDEEYAGLVLEAAE